MKNIAILLVSFISLLSCQAQQEQKTELVSPKEFSGKIEVEKGQVIDVRTPGEYNSGHIEGAQNLHIYDKDFEQRVDKLDKSQPVYVYCKAGGRSAEAVEIMKSKGFENIVELDGGMDAWKEKGMPIE